jgi:predicted DNA-binding transcriptional regulator YafY
MGRHSTIESIARMLQIVKLMSQEGGATLSQMEKATDIDRWTIKDMIDSLETMNTDGKGLCITEYKDPTDKRKTYYQIDRANLWTLTLPGLSLSDDEGMLLALMMSQSQQTPVLKDAAQGLQTKLSWFKDAQNYQIYNVNATEKIISEYAKEAVSVILKAINQGKCLSFTYDNAGNTKLARRDVMPLYMFVYDGGLYLNAQKIEDGEPRTFALERIQDVPKIISPRKRPKPLPYDGRLEDPFGPFCEHKGFTFSVTFDSWQGWYNMQKRWPDSIKVKRNPDGTCTLTARTRGLHVVKKWIMGQAKNVKKIEPKWLRDKILEDIDAMTSAIRKN